MATIYDEYASQIVHVKLDGGAILHVAVAGDAKSATCLETGIAVKGESRDECLNAIVALMELRCQ
jgi:hypothetical protein